MSPRDRDLRALPTQRPQDWPDVVALVVAAGWSMPHGLEPCASCGHGTPWRDPGGAPRHPGKSCASKG